MLAFLSILMTALAAFMGAPVWFTLFGAAVLTAISLSEQRKLTGRFEAIGATHVLSMAAWQSAGHGLMAAGAAYAIGYVSGLAFQLSGLYGNAFMFLLLRQ